MLWKNSVPLAAWGRANFHLSSVCCSFFLNRWSHFFRVFKHDKSDRRNLEMFHSVICLGFSLLKESGLFLQKVRIGVCFFFYSGFEFSVDLSLCVYVLTDMEQLVGWLGSWRTWLVACSRWGGGHWLLKELLGMACLRAECA